MNTVRVKQMFYVNHIDDGSSEPWEAGEKALAEAGCDVFVHHKQFDVRNNRAIVVSLGYVTEPAQPQFTEADRALWSGKT